jgi:hypothetical protein
MGQFGLGPDELEEIGRPKLHSWSVRARIADIRDEVLTRGRFEEQIEDGKLSRDGKEGSGGLEAVACGGMHTLAVDEGGKVRYALRGSADFLGPVLGDQRQRRTGEDHCQRPRPDKPRRRHPE